MALVKLEELPVSDKASNLPSDVPLSQDAYSTRIKDAVFGMSKSSGKPMITLDCEIYSPDTIKSHYDGKTYTVAGISDKKYLSLGPDSLQYTLEFMRQIGLKPEIDPENPDCEQFKNKAWRNLWYAEEQNMNKPQSEEDKLAGKKPEPICKEDGTPIKFFRSKMGRVVGPTSAPLPAA
jgi:hypothetical protein